MKKTILTLTFLVAAFTMQAQWVQLGADLFGEQTGDVYGVSVTISDDGTRMASGAHFNDDGGTEAGKIIVYDYDGANWIPVGNPILGEAAGDRAGESIDFDSSGNRLVIGARFNDDGGSAAGHVRVFEFQSGDWVQIGSDIDGDAAADAFGRSVSISDDGQRIAIGIPFNDENGAAAGKVKAFEWSGSDWQQLGTDILGAAADDIFGQNVQINGTGNTLIVGAPQDITRSGYAAVYEYSGTNWQQKGSIVTGNDPADFFGGNVAISDNGNLIAIQARDSNSGGVQNGSVKVFRFSGNSWTQVGPDIPGESDFSFMGSDLRWHNNNVLVASASNTGPAAKIYYFQMTGNTWSLIDDTLVGSTQGIAFGQSLDISGSGQIIVVGTPNLNSNTGRTQVFQNENLLSNPAVTSDQRIRLLPNPNQGSFRLEFPTTITSGNVEIYSVTGKLLLTRSLENQDGVSLDLNLATGVYLARISTEQATEVLRFVVK